jgi:predicted enzyme related to lactoylglutathione lyase
MVLSRSLRSVTTTSYILFAATNPRQDGLISLQPASPRPIRKIEEGSFDFFSPNHRVRDTRKHQQQVNRTTGAMTTPTMKISGLGWISIARETRGKARSSLLMSEGLKRIKTRACKGVNHSRWL